MNVQGLILDSKAGQEVAHPPDHFFLISNKYLRYAGLTGCNKSEKSPHIAPLALWWLHVMS